MRATAPAKINLTLRIGARRKDGLHELSSLVVFADLADHLDITCGDDISKSALDVSGPFAAVVPRGEDNLVLRALEFLGEFLEQPASIRLEKNIPVGAGLGGGSADAAALLRALGGQPDMVQLMKLGADVPACYLSCPLWMSGAGEVLRPLSALPPLWCVLICPDIHISTRDMFACWDEMFAHKRHDKTCDIKADFSTAEDLFAFCARCHNDFEPLICARVPEVGQALDLLQATKPAFAGMSGSGPACFGLYAEEARAQNAADHLRAASKHWLWLGQIRS